MLQRLLGVASLALLPLGVFAASTGVVSVGSNGFLGNNASYYPSVSADGRYVAFASLADNLVVGDTNGAFDVFVHDSAQHITRRISVRSNGREADGDSLWPSISADGRYVAFHSNASNLVSGDANNTWDVFVHDLQTGGTELISRKSGGFAGWGESLNPDISADGRYVAFQSLANDLVAGDTNNELDVFVFDRKSGTTERVSVSSAAAQGNSYSLWPSISGDGRYVVFQSFSSNLVKSDSNGTTDIFLHDRSFASTRRISVSSSGSESNGLSYWPVISADGTTVVFSSMATNLTVGDNNRMYDIFAHDVVKGTTVNVSGPPDGGFANQHSYWPSVSADGQQVVFISLASNLVAGDTNGTWDVFVHDRRKGKTQRVSVGREGGQGNNLSYWPDISDSGRYIVFASTASNLVTGDKNGVWDVFLHDRGPLNLPPVANAGGDVVSACSAPATAIQLDGSGSIDPDGDMLTYTWRGAFGEVSGPAPRIDFPLGSHRVELLVDDGSGGSDLDAVHVGILDNTAPWLAVGNDVTLEAVSADGAPFVLVPDAGDACGSVTVTVDPAPLMYPLGRTQVRVMATDLAGNSMSDGMYVTVADTTPPTVVAPPDVSAEATGRSSVVEIGTAAANDAVGVVELTSDAPAAFGLGQTLVTWTARDAAGNAGRGTQTVLISDTKAPMLQPPPDVTVEAAGLVTAVDLGEPAVHDTVGVTSVSNDASDTFALGVTVVTWTALDGAGNRASATQTVTVLDTTAPVLQAPADLVVEAAGRLTNVALGEPVVSDAVGVAALAHDAPAAGFEVGTTQVTWRATDTSGNETVVVQRVTVQDTTPPRLSSSPDITVEAGGVWTEVKIGEAIASDLVGIAAVSHDAPLEFPVGETLVTWVATDGAGNRTEATQWVRVRDTVAPTLAAPAPVTVEATGPLTAVALGQPAVQDLVGIESVTNDAPAQFGVGSFIVTWIAVDTSGNRADAVQQVTVRDSTPPVVMAPPDLAVEAVGALTAVDLGIATAVDTVDGPLPVAASDMGPFAVGTHEIRWSASDRSGNRTTVVQTLHVNNVAPRLAVLGGVAFNEGGALIKTVTFEDPNSTRWAVTVDYGDGAMDRWSTEVRQFQLNHVYVQDGDYVVQVTVTDEYGASVGGQLQAAVSNAAPELGELNISAAQVSVDDPVAVTAVFSDPGTKDVHSGFMDWGDGTRTPVIIEDDDGGMRLRANHVYDQAGYYALQLHLSDSDGGSAERRYEYLVVVNPRGGFVTGGGWMASAPGSFSGDPELAGVLRFTLKAAYGRDADVPRGRLNVRYQAAGLYLSTDQLDWLVVADGVARIQGTAVGRNGEPFGFLVTAADGDGARQVDTVRLRLWRLDTGMVVYDNRSGLPLDSPAGAPLSRGSLLVHGEPYGVEAGARASGSTAKAPIARLRDAWDRLSSDFASRLKYMR